MVMKSFDGCDILSFSFKIKKKIQYCCADNRTRGTDLRCHVVIVLFTKAPCIK